MASSTSEKPDGIDLASKNLRYPTREYSPPATMGRTERDAWIAELEALLGNLRNAVEGLSDNQLNKPYRPGGWTVRQVVHHIAEPSPERLYVCSPGA